MSGKKFGEEGRHKARIEHIERVTKESIKLLANQFPDPAIRPSESDFISGWEAFFQSLIKTFGRQNDFRQAFNVGVRQIKKYQVQHGWDFSPPHHIFTNRPSPQLRNPSWQKGAWALHDAYQQWNGTYSKLESRDIQYRYQSLLLSLLMDSGQCNIDVLKAFNLKLKSSEALPVQSFSGYTFITLVLNNDNLNSNAEHDGERLTIYQCYLSLKTLGQLKLWQKLDKKDWQYPEDANAILAKMKENFPNHKDLPTKAQMFCSCASFWYERHSNPTLSEALLEFRIGRTHSYSLPTSNLIRLIAPTVQPVQPASFYDFSTKTSANYRRTECVNTLGLPLKHNQFISKLKEACKPSIDGNKVSPKTVRAKLETVLGEFELVGWQQVFVQWLIYKTHDCKASTVNGYMLNQAKYWYKMNTERPLLDVTSTVELEEIYQEHINFHMTPKAKGFYAKRLKDLHVFAAALLNLPAVNDIFFRVDVGKRHTRAGLIDERLFKGLLKHIETLKDLNDTDQEALQCICIIAYRCGLRMNELYKLTIDSVEASRSGWIEIRPNRFGNNKTASSLRKVPLWPLLLENEVEIVSNYIQSKRRQSLAKSAPLLTMGEDVHRPFNMFTVSNYVGRALRAHSGEPHFVFYHLRHSCFSRLQVMLEHREPHTILPHFYPYSDEQTKDIKKRLFKQTYCNKYWEIAALAGHESPRTTFEHYFHLSDLLSAPVTEENHRPLSQTDAQKNGLFSRRQYQALANQKGEANFGDSFPMLASSLDIEDIVSSTVDDDFNEVNIDVPTRKKRIPIDVCYQVLEAVSGGEGVESLAYKYQLKSEDINRWLDHARALKSLSTNYNAGVKGSRFFTEKRAHTLVPGKYKTIEEKEYANRFLARLRDHYGNDRENIQSMIAYALQHTYVSKSGITFSSPSTLRLFIKTFQFAIPKSDWRAVKLGINNSIIKDEWLEVLCDISTAEEKRGTLTGRSGKGSVRLELKSPSEDKYTKNEYKKYSSHILIYVFYMAYIMFENPPPIGSHK
ncbi:tyrosine-type recombinase/integrase [Vibrio hannami]|uniref:tyrosine-type recombinase/integrase n=1 Tax=Vibrio hannami TaxID=2717094 RepID=UPI00240FE03A|nr:tyrosine-type recombinase/integrase [Vibrio hannami]MDG3085276.1 tyrosine-type recombinase/integrase [Vibrio hannami]